MSSVVIFAAILRQTVMRMSRVIFVGIIYRSRGGPCANEKERKFQSNDNTCSLCLHSLVKTKANVWENSRADQIRFSPAQEFSQTLPRFSPGYKGTKNMFYFFYKITISVLTKREMIYEARMYTSNFIDETLNS